MLKQSYSNTQALRKDKIKKDNYSDDNVLKVSDEIKKLINLISHKINEVYSDKSKKYREICDTEPEAHIAEQISKAAKETGCGWKISRFDW